MVRSKLNGSIMHGLDVELCSRTPNHCPRESAHMTVGDEEKANATSKRLSSSHNSDRSLLRVQHVLFWAITSALGCFVISRHLPTFSFLQALSRQEGSLASINHFTVRAALSQVLEVFQVYPPVVTVTSEGVLEITDGSANGSIAIVDDRRPSCQETLVAYSFANSYGTPYVGDYNPPTCDFNHISWNLTVTSAGRQFDRIAIVYLGDVEVFRTSTAEPTANGIEWTYLKVIYCDRARIKLTTTGYDNFRVLVQAKADTNL